MQKKGFEFSFTWMFVLIVGAAILFLAVFMASRLITREGTTYNTEVAAELGAALTPIETSVEDEKYAPIQFPSETRVINECDAEGTFGEQALAVTVRSGVGKEWAKTGIPYRSSYSFIFSPDAFQAKQAHVIASSVSFPFRVGNAVVLYADSYCFVNPPEDIEDALVQLGAEGMTVVPSRGACAEESISVCFSTNGCDIRVDADSVHRGVVHKGTDSLPYVDGLFYAALVAEPDLYECQLMRIRKRTSEVARLYAEKSAFLDARGCSSHMASDLITYRANLLNEDIPLNALSAEAEVLQRINDRLACALF